MKIGWNVPPVRQSEEKQQIREVYKEELELISGGCGLFMPRVHIPSTLLQ